ncbi:hypothetical protein QBC41DRAFT_396889, partial [Cercophora samala]
MYPDRGDAVIVLGNSSHCGYTVDCVAKLLTAIVSDQHLETDELIANARLDARCQTGRWRRTLEELREQQAHQARTQPPFDAAAIFGIYRNDDTNVVLRIIADSTGVEMPDGSTIGAAVVFGNTRTAQPIPLWTFCNDTLCFLPLEEDYVRWGMCSLSRWSQFLIHLSFRELNEEARGVWWQYSHDEDALWFPRVPPDGE